FSAEYKHQVMARSFVTVCKKGFQQPLVNFYKNRVDKDVMDCCWRHNASRRFARLVILSHIHHSIALQTMTVAQIVEGR
ncbi:MAG TPA: hypothetical protein VJ799_12510, partial [Nitrososphaeraceae archaeon]|nr:hypothetical protein [Nitrososphaeraceae archaeon]